MVTGVKDAAEKWCIGARGRTQANDRRGANVRFHVVLLHIFRERYRQAL